MKMQISEATKKLALLILISLSLTTTSAIAQTESPSPTPSASQKPTATAKAEPVATKTPAATKKPAAKPKPKKKKAAPSPKAKWPPRDFISKDGVFAKVPTAKELLGIISATKSLTKKVEECTKFVCGAVQVATQMGCVWWEVNSRVYSQEKELIGGLQTVTSGSLPREIKTILLISPEPLDSLEYISNIEVVCHQEAKPAGTPSTSFTRLVP